MLDRMGTGAGDRFINAERPLVVSVTSQGDWATGKFFPLGTGLSNAFRPSRPYGELGRSRQPLPRGTTQRDFITQTPGHNELLRSHHVEVDRTRIAPSSRKVASGTSAQVIFDQNLAAPLAPTGTPGNRTWRFRSLAKGGGTCLSEIRNFPGARMRTGYWIVQTPKEVIYDHGDIFNEQALAMYAAIFRIANPGKASRTAAPRQLGAPGSSGSPVHRR
jgi:hypothetical protein